MTGAGGSSSSSRLTLEATLESALITFEDVRPFVLGFVSSRLLLERGVAGNKKMLGNSSC